MKKEKNVGNILVLDAHLRASLVAIRSLGQRNVGVTAGSETRFAMGLFSKYCGERIIYPNPRSKTKSFLEHMESLIKKNDYDLVLPTHTYTTYILKKYKNIFSKNTQVTPPDFNVFVNAYDKKRLLRIAEKNGISCPITYCYSDLDEISENIHEYPVVVKPSKIHGMGIAICNSKSELEKTYAQMTKKIGSCFVQEYIPNGGEFGVCALFNYDSDPIALTVHKRIRSMNSYGGVSTMRTTVENNDIVQTALGLLKTIKWSGVAMVEFRVDSRTGIPKLMEINPRFWGSLQLSYKAGVDFPYLLYRLTAGDNLTPNLNYKTGVRCRWLYGDILSLLRGQNTNGGLREFMNFNVNYDIAALSDPHPVFFSLFSHWSFNGGIPHEEDQN